MEKEKLHFMETPHGYQCLTSECYDGFDKDKILRETTKEITPEEKEKIWEQGWEKVRQYIKDILDKE